MVTLLLACTSVETAPEVVFLRDAVRIGDQIQPLDWSPGEEHFGARAPRRAECLPLFSVDLGDTASLAAVGGSAPDTALAFSPDGALLAVGSYLGEVLILDGWTGEVRARRRLAETMVKQVAWSEDGQTLYAAEQSPDAYVHAFDRSLDPVWKLRLADRVGSSPAPPPDSLYGVYDLPAAYGLVVLPGGDLLVSATHGWNGEEGRLNRSQVLRISSTGEVLAAWPPEPANALFMHPRVRGDRVVFTVTKSSTTPEHQPEVQAPGIQVLSLPDLTPVLSWLPSPLEPWRRSKRAVWDRIMVCIVSIITSALSVTMGPRS